MMPKLFAGLTMASASCEKKSPSDTSTLANWLNACDQASHSGRHLSTSRILSGTNVMVHLSGGAMPGQRQLDHQILDPRLARSRDVLQARFAADRARGAPGRTGGDAGVIGDTANATATLPV
jgi:hypothetical protein